MLSDREPEKFLFELDLFGHLIEVVEVEPDVFAAEGRSGEYASMLKKIRLRKGIAGGPAAEAETLIHECIHACDAIALPSDKTLDEDQVLALGLALTHLLRHNEELWKYLRKRLR